MLDNFNTALQNAYAAKIVEWQLKGEFQKAEHALRFVKEFSRLTDLGEEVFYYDIHKCDETDLLNWIRGYGQSLGYNWENTHSGLESVYFAKYLEVPVIKFTKRRNIYA